MSQQYKQLKVKLDRIITGIDTPAGRAFDVALIAAILISVVLMILDSILEVHASAGEVISVIQNILLGLFTIEYILRVLIAESKFKYLTSFYGIVDLLAIAPIYLALFIPFGRYFAIIRVMRLLRLFSVFKMGRYIDESGSLLKAIRASKAKIIVFLVAILFIVVIVGALMYAIEGPERGFSNIPESMYWAIVTISTVGYGDISPQTEIGKIIASGLMLVGYAIIAVPTGIITSEIAYSTKGKNINKKTTCEICGTKKHVAGADYCYKCGHEL